MPTIDEWKQIPQTDVVTAGREFYGLGETASYGAARRGEIPTLRIGRKLIVPVRRVLEQLGIE
ncbi:hypothetical protein M2317_002933 [Microbacterium sp. ZKA21]|uniref:hypothetical protein n=1 Tax=Microbacterium sp. ZKA21 TaxID=3381694 RepID=UPI003D1F2950